MYDAYFSGYEWGFMCDCDSRDVGNSWVELDMRESKGDGDVVECPYCGTEWEVGLTKVSG